ncbi:hypothetical protein E2C01_096535 [Portunus trituberculatus]|uniref:Uncharacterized protein n=1 Tax=Portunus trituberculatus TaxID=210409 RepID=A0A5B7K8H5_PORTR|nr:hypothetical protein [Portunus trituberculatus]
MTPPRLCLPATTTITTTNNNNSRPTHSISLPALPVQQMPSLHTNMHPTLCSSHIGLGQNYDP